VLSLPSQQLVERESMNENISHVAEEVHQSQGRSLQS